MNPLDLVSAAKWRSATFTTYALSLSFFEAVVLDSLVRGGSRSAQIFADPEGIRSGLAEEGARRVGREYALEPVACGTGVFHPKLSVFLSDDDAHLLVGSGNLTFGGWGGNLEVVEHLHRSFAADAIDDAADFFELLTMSDTIRTEADEACIELAHNLRAANRGSPRTGRIRLLHSVAGSVAAGISRFADELGGARQITIVSPYYELDGRGIDALADTLTCDNVRLHVHPNVVQGTGASRWPFERSRAGFAVSVSEPFADDGRPLHAKSIEIICRRGRLLVSGSANGTYAGLFGANVEASLVRIQRDTSVGWVASPIIPPHRLASDIGDEEEPDSSRTGILRASLEAGTIEATVIVPVIRGPVTVSVRSARTHRELGHAVVDERGHLTIDAPGLEQDAWASGRLILRIQHDDKVSEGFIAIAAAAELFRRAGSMAPRILAVLAGSDTPEDVAAILAWFRENPDRLPRATLPSSTSDSDPIDHGPKLVSLADLRGGIPEKFDNGSGQSGSTAWKHAMAMLRSAFSARRGQWTDDEREDGEPESDPALQAKRSRHERKKAEAISSFDKLLPAMINRESPHADPTMALAIAHFITDRIHPPVSQVLRWIRTITQATDHFGGPGAQQVLGALLVSCHADGTEDAVVRARQTLLSKGFDPLAIDPTVLASVPAFVDQLAAGLNPSELVTRIREAQTAGEWVGAYLAAAEREGPLPNSRLLSRSQYWPQLRLGFNNPEILKKWRLLETPAAACPRCHMTFAKWKADDLRLLGVTECCGRLILCRAI